MFHPHDARGKERLFMKKSVRIILSALCGTVLSLFVYVLALPPIHAQAPEFWMFLTSVVLFYGVPFCLLGASKQVGGNRGKKDKKGNNKSFKEFSLVGKVVCLLALAPVLVVFVGSVISSTFFNAKAYFRI